MVIILHLPPEHLEELNDLIEQVTRKIAENKDFLQDVESAALREQYRQVLVLLNQVLECSEKLNVHYNQAVDEYINKNTEELVRTVPEKHGDLIRETVAQKLSEQA